FEECKKLVLRATAPLGSKYTDIVKSGFENRWIDVYPNKGKRSGAFSSGTYDSNPIILSNYMGVLDSVSTIAHEMGHSMHSWFSNHTQQPQNAEYTIFVAEVASTVNEILLIEMLLKDNEEIMQEMKEKKESGQEPEIDDFSLLMARFSLLNHYLESFKGTVFRQTMFAEFEKKAHDKAEQGEALNATVFNDIYKELIKDYFGPELVIDDEVQYEWARIPHFYSPFYVYKYATSYAASVAIADGILNGGQENVDNYLKFLTLGGSLDPLDELKVAGVDWSTKGPMDKALERFGEILNDACDVYDRLMGVKIKF
ncbi:MAG: oligoendopeptidase F, partial [Lachnospiraceae bacterium]|nr:oligoendopeptidase F [Lachnospiraceae bacterium]